MSFPRTTDSIAWFAWSLPDHCVPCACFRFTWRAAMIAADRYEEMAGTVIKKNRRRTIGRGGFLRGIRVSCGKRWVFDCVASPPPPPPPRSRSAKIHALWESRTRFVRYDVGSPTRFTRRYEISYRTRARKPCRASNYSRFQLSRLAKEYTRTR